MRKYRGYYIDGVIFHSEKEIDESIKRQAIDAYKNAVKIFIYRQDLEASSLCDEKADNLLKLGFSWEEIEALELEAYDEREKELEKFDKEHPNWEQLINV